MTSTHTAREQLFLEYTNRARLDPLGEAGRLGLDLGPNGLNRGLPAGSISGDPVQPLAPNMLLRTAAEKHSQWMLDSNVFSHTGQGGSTIRQRIEAEGYSIVPPGGTGENLSWRGALPTIDLDAQILPHHKGLFDSDGHRSNILRDWFKEAGVAQLQGPFTHSNGVTYQSSMLTNKFAASGSQVFVTGVFYQDTDGNAFYSLGEGVGGMTVAASGSMVLTQSAGGYALGVLPAAGVSVTLTWGAESLSALADLSAGNVKLDLVRGYGEVGAGGSLRILSSGNLELKEGAVEAALLGAGHLSLKANDAGNLLIGNTGNNTLAGGAGNDVFEGGAGNDTIHGGGGVNTARYSGNFTDYLIETVADVTTVSDLRANSPDGTDTLTAVQVLQFADRTHQLIEDAPQPPEGFHLLSGSVALRGGGADLSGTQVTFTPATDGEILTAETDAAGAFSFQIATGMSGTLSVVRPYSPGSNPGDDKPLTALDALEVLRLVASLGPSNPDNPSTGMNILAADFNGDGQVTALDALGILMHVGQFDAAAAPRWRFTQDPDALPALNDLTGPGLGPVPQPSVPASIAIAGLEQDMHHILTGILSGDMGHYDAFV